MPTSNRALYVTTLSMLVVAGTIRPARADDDDKKLLSHQPAVVAKPFRASSPDPWKLMSRLPAISGEGDTTFQSSNINLKSWLPLNSFPGYPGTSANGADCWGYRSPSGREYALMGLSWGNGIGP